MKKRRSKLELYIAALEALAVNGAMNTTRLSLKSKVNGGPLKRILLDLTERDLVERRTLGRKNVYAATSKTRAILSQVEELGRILPITEMTATSCRIVRY